MGNNTPITKSALLEYVQLHPTAVEIDRNDVPENLWKLIPYAEIWGVSDDDFRGEVFNSTSLEALRHVRCVFEKYENEIENWLAGDEGLDPEYYTAAYIAFSSWVMGMDGIY